MDRRPGGTSGDLGARAQTNENNLNDSPECEALWPIRIAKGSLGTDMPDRDLLLSLRHQALVKSPSSQVKISPLDGATGREKWVFDPDAPQPDSGKPLLDVALLAYGSAGLMAARG